MRRCHYCKNPINDNRGYIREHLGKTINVCTACMRGENRPDCGCEVEK